MLKGIGLFIACFLLVLVVLVWLQPSPQESAVISLTAAENVLEGIKGSEAPAKLDEARKVLSDMKLPSEAQEARDKAIASLDQAKTIIGGDQVGRNAEIATVKAQIALAKSNLTALTVAERVKIVKDQILALAWPIVIAILILYIFNSKSALEVLKHIGSLVSNVKVPGGLEIAFAGGAAVKNTQEEVIKGYRQQVITQYDLAATQTQISDTVERIIKERVTPFLKERELDTEFRCTIHVRDILFQNSLYQLIDYLPKKWMRSGKITRGRAWSVRYGLIGRCWRLEQNQTEGTIPTVEEKLIEQWGLTKNEASGSSGKQTMLCYLIRSQNQSPLAIFYLDAEEANAFGDGNGMAELVDVVQKAVQEFKLSDALEKVWMTVQSSAPLIEIYADPR